MPGRRGRPRSAHSAGSGEDTLVAFSQRDPQWADRQLGVGKPTIGDAGCLLCAAASMLASWGWQTNPAKLNAWLLTHEGYVDGNLFVFASIDGLRCRVSEVIRCERTPAAMGKLRQALATGHGVLACVDWQPGGKQQPHWVWLLELGDDTGRIMDPWQTPGNELQPLERYLAEGWTPARGLFAAAIYERLARQRHVDWVGPMEEYQESVYLRAEG